MSKRSKKLSNISKEPEQDLFLLAEIQFLKTKNSQLARALSESKQSNTRLALEKVDVEEKLLKTNMRNNELQNYHQIVNGHSKAILQQLVQMTDSITELIKMNSLISTNFDDSTRDDYTFAENTINKLLSKQSPARQTINDNLIRMPVVLLNRLDENEVQKENSSFNFNNKQHESRKSTSTGNLLKTKLFVHPKTDNLDSVEEEIEDELSASNSSNNEENDSFTGKDMSRSSNSNSNHEDNSLSNEAMEEDLLDSSNPADRYILNTIDEESENNSDLLKITTSLRSNQSKSMTSFFNNIQTNTSNNISIKKPLHDSTNISTSNCSTNLTESNRSLESSCETVQEARCHNSQVSSSYSQSDLTESNNGIKMESLSVSDMKIDQLLSNTSTPIKNFDSPRFQNVTKTRRLLSAQSPEYLNDSLRKTKQAVLPKQEIRSLRSSRSTIKKEDPSCSANFELNVQSSGRPRRNVRVDCYKELPLNKKLRRC